MNYFVGLLFGALCLGSPLALGAAPVSPPPSPPKAPVMDDVIAAPPGPKQGVLAPPSKVTRVGEQQGIQGFEFRPDAETRVLIDGDKFSFRVYVSGVYKRAGYNLVYETRRLAQGSAAGTPFEIEFPIK